MRDADFALRFAGLVERRLSALLQREVSSLDVEKYLQTQGFGPAESEALAWGRLTEIGPEDCRRLSELLDLDQSLLALCLLPTSLEVFRRSLLAAQSLFCRSYCPVCDALAERTYLLHPEAAWEEEEGRPLATEDAEDLDEIDRLRDLALDYLLHLSSNAEAQGRFYAEGLDPLSDLMQHLSAQARLKVYAFALDELNNERGQASLMALQSVSKLREGFLTPLARRALDEAAKSPSGEISADRLRVVLGLTNMRAVGQILRSVRRGLEKLERSGYPLAHEVIVYTEHGRGLRLKGATLQQWRSLLQAEGLMRGESGVDSALL